MPVVKPPPGEGRCVDWESSPFLRFQDEPCDPCRGCRGRVRVSAGGGDPGVRVLVSGVPFAICQLHARR